MWSTDNFSMAITKHECGGLQEESHTGAKSMLPGSSLQVAKSFIWLETAEGFQEEVEQEVAMLCPLICREALQKGKGASRKLAIVLPPQVSSSVLRLILEYCRFHQVPGRSNKERKLYDERFIRLDTKRLCELTSAADSLQMKPLVDLTSRALARMIEGKTPEEIRETFHLPDDLTEEEKLEPLKNTTDDPRIRLLNRLYARKRRELQDKEKLKCMDHDEGLKDERSVEDLLSFINGVNGDCKSGKGGKCKKKRHRRKKEPLKGQVPENASSNKMKMISRQEMNVREVQPHTRLCSPSNGDPQRSGSTVDDERFAFEAEFDVYDGLDPLMKEELDREVEDFARRLNSDWSERKRMQEYLAANSQEQRQISQEQRQIGPLSLRVASISLVDSWGGGKASRLRSQLEKSRAVV